MSKLIAETADFGAGIQPVSPIYGQQYTDERRTPLDDLEILVSTGISVLTVVAAIFFIVYFFMGALKWVTAGGDGGKVGKARDEMVQGVVGLIVIVAAYGVLGLIGTILGIDFLRPADTIMGIIPI